MMGSEIPSTPSLQHSVTPIVPNTPMAKSKKSPSRPAKRASIHDERWLHFYRQMLKIRLFEEEVTQLYLSAKMPGLAHLSIVEEPVGVGVCEGLGRAGCIPG